MPAPGAGRAISRRTRATHYDLPTIRNWLEKFLFRFFETSQFKRSAIPNGPKVSAGGALSPRGDWRAPSDGIADGLARRIAVEAFHRVAALPCINRPRGAL